MIFTQLQEVETWLFPAGSPSPKQQNHRQQQMPMNDIGRLLPTALIVTVELRNLAAVQCQHRLLIIHIPSGNLT
jgi:hypothetical protein